MSEIITLEVSACVFFRDLCENRSSWGVVKVETGMGGAEKDLAMCVEAYGRALSLYARQWLDEDSAADILQQAFLKLLSQGKGPKDVRAWLFRTVRNAALNEVRRLRTAARHARTITASKSSWFLPSPEDRLDAKLAQEALASLPAEDRELVVLRIWGQMTFAQIAELTSLSVSSVHTRYTEALEKLRNRMVTHAASR